MSNFHLLKTQKSTHKVDSRKFMILNMYYLMQQFKYLGILCIPN